MKEKIKKATTKIPIIYSLLKFARNMLIDYPKWVLFKIAKNWVILNRISMRIRPWLWKMTGVNIKGRINIAYDVYYDVGNAHLITIEEDVWIAPGVKILCHRRDASMYYKGGDYNKLPYVFGKVVLEKGCSIGMGAMIMPGVTIGEGAMIGSGAVVTKDIPAWTIAVGNPAKVIKEVPPKDSNNEENN